MKYLLFLSNFGLNFDDPLLFTLMNLLLDSLLKIGFKYRSFYQILPSFLGLLSFTALIFEIIIITHRVQKAQKQANSSDENKSNLDHNTLKKDLRAFILNLIVVTIFIECEIQPFSESLNIIEGFKLGFIQIALAKRIFRVSFQYLAGFLVFFYANFRLVHMCLWLQNCCFFSSFIIMSFFLGVFLNKRKVIASPKLSLKNPSKNPSFQEQKNIGQSNIFPLIPTFIAQKLWKKSDICLIILDSTLIPIYKTPFFEKTLAKKPKFLEIQIQVLKIKLLNPTTSNPDLSSFPIKDPSSFPIKDPQNLEDFLSKLISTTDDSNSNNVYIKFEEYPKTSNYIHVYRYFENQTQFLAILFTNSKPDLEFIVQNQSRVLSFVSHEFRTPLNCITGMLQSLQNTVPATIYEQYIQPALSSGKYLMNMLQDILDMTQIKAGKFSLNLIDFDLSLLLKDIFTLFQVQAKTKKISLSFEISPAIPKILNTDPNRLKQIIINLVSNAFKYTQKGEIMLFCEPLNNDPNILRFAIQDTGLGIKDIDKPRLLKAFGKIEDEKNKELNPQGVGLGLLISQDIAKLLAKDLLEIPDIEKGIRFESEYTKGSVFSFIFENKKKIEVKKFTNSGEIDDLNDDSDEEGPEVNFEQLKNSEIEKKFLNRSRRKIPNYKIVLNNKFISRMFSKKKNQIICQMSFSKEEPIEMIKQNSLINQMKSYASENDIFYNFHQNLMRSVQVENKINNNSEKMSLLHDLSLSFSSNSKKSNAPDIGKLQEIVSKVENFQKKCPCAEVLVCDDDSYNILALQFLLESLNISCETASCGDEAICKVKDRYDPEIGGFCCHYFKVIFLDIEMPGKNGLETCKEIKEFFKTSGSNIDETKIVACSGYNNQEMNTKIKETGFNCQLVKPIMKGTLIGVLSEFMNNNSKKSSSLSINFH